MEYQSCRSRQRLDAVSIGNWAFYVRSRRTVAGQAQDNNSEEELDGANAKGDDFEHA